MKKTILLSFALFLSSLAFSARYDLPLANLGSSGWGGWSYDGKGSITYVEAWTGCGWWLLPTDFSAFKKLVVNFEPLPFPMRIVIEYDGAENSAGDLAAGMTTGEVLLNASGAGKVKQIYLQSGNGGVGTIVVKEAYVTDGSDEPGILPSSLIDFDKVAIGTIYKTMHAWGWPDAGTSASIVADPLRTGNSLKMIADNYDGVTYFTVTLPKDITVADITGIKFESYFGDKTTNAAVEIFIASPSAQVGNGANFNSYPVYLKTSDSDSKPTPVLQVSTPNNWYTISITREQICNDNFNFGVKYDFNAVNNLNEFLFGIGISGPGEYFMDNVEFLLKGGSGIQIINPIVPKVYGVNGGIIISADNESYSIYGIDGSLKKQAISNSKSTIAMPQGIYIVKTGSTNPVKVLVK